MSKIPLEDLDKYENESSIEKFKKKPSNSNKAHKKTKKKEKEDEVDK